MSGVAGPVVISAREYNEAVARLERARQKLADAQAGLEASELIARESRKRFLETLYAYGVDDDGDPQAKAQQIWTGEMLKRGCK